MNIYTKTGDKGETSLYGGTRLPKDDLRVWCYGSVDEANSVLGTIYAALEFDDLKAIVREIQKKMFVVGAQLASDEKGREKLTTVIVKEDIAFLENVINEYTDQFGKSKNFIIPGETTVSALMHVARTAVRRSERYVVTLSRNDDVCPLVLKYLNRLSDTLFVLAKLEVYKSFVKKVADRIMELAGAEGTPAQPGADPLAEIAGAPSTYNWPKLCDHLRKAAEAESLKLGVPVCFSLVDSKGTLIYFSRFDGALLTSIPISQNKAYTAVALKMPSGDLAEAAGPGGSLFGLNTADPRVVIFGGGFPLKDESGRIVGGIGISGGSVEEDEQIGRAVIEAFHSYL